MIPSHLHRRLRWTAGLVLATASASLVAADSVLQAPTLLSREGIVLFSGEADRWLWTRASGTQETLYEGGPNRPARSLATGSGWTALAAGGPQIWLIRRDRKSAELLRVDGGPGAAPKVVLSGLQSPGGLAAGGGHVYWLENRPPRSAAAHLPTHGWTTLLRTRSAAGVVRTLVEWPGGGPPAEPSASGDMIGLVGDRLYFRVRRAACTEFVCMPLPSGPPSRVAVERGLQTAILDGGRLCWTAPSDEAGAASGLRCVRAHNAHGEVETLGDWLPAEGAPVLLNGKLLHVGSQVHRLNGSAAPGRWLAQLPHGRYGHDTRRLVLLTGSAPAVFPVKGL